MLAIVVPGFVFPGLGIVVAAGLAFTAYRGRRRLQLTLLAIGVVVTALALLAWVLALGGDTSIDRDPAVRVRP